LLVLGWGILCPATVSASIKEYTCEIGAQVGCGYYVGDATKMIFTNPREVLGGQFRYNFDKRWAMQFKAQRQRVAFTYVANLTEIGAEPTVAKFQNPMWSIDAVAEYNFFRFGLHPYDERIKPITPYVCLGIGVAMHNKMATPLGGNNPKYPALEFLKMSGGVYIPIGIGVKWKFAERWQLQALWQHQVYLTDNVEGYMAGYDDSNAIQKNEPSILNNSNGMNGWNLFNNDLTSSLTIGITFSFGEREKMCYFCDE